MWKTRDGKRLNLLHSDLTRVKSRLRRRKVRGLQPKAGTSTGGDFSFLRPLKRLANGARQIGVLRRPDCNCVYPVFTATLGRREFRILTRPLPNGVNAIISIRIQLDDPTPTWSSGGDSR